jgi:hypothetical protein
MYQIGQGIIRSEDLVIALRKSGSPVALEHFSTPPSIFLHRWGETALQHITDLQVPIWFIIGPSHRRTHDWRAIAPNGELCHLTNDQIFSTAKLAHGTHKFQKWVVIDELHNKTVPELAGDCPLTGVQFRLLNRFQFVALMQPRGAFVKPTGLVNSFNDLGPLVFNTPHFNENHGKVIKSKYGVGYVVQPQSEPTYNFSHRCNAVVHDHFNSYPQGHDNRYYIPLRFLEPYAIPTGDLAPQTLGILNWCISGCDSLIHRSL